MTSGLENKKRTAYYTYDFAKHGGAVSAIAINGDGIPAGAIIADGIIHVRTAIAASAASTTGAIMAIGANDIYTAATITAAFALNAMLATIPVGTAATCVRVTSNISKLTFTIGVQPITAGKFTVALDYWITA